MTVMNPTQTPVLTYTKDVTIASGAALSDSTGDLYGLRPVRLIIPADMEGTVLTFSVASDEAVSTFNNMRYDNYGTNTEFSVAITTAAQDISLAPYLAYFFGVRALKVRAGTAASTSAQNAAVTITVVAEYLG